MLEISPEKADLYPTPAWATRALLAVEPFNGPIWEPACGRGAMSSVLEGARHLVLSSDAYDWGYGLTGYDFLTSSGRSSNVVTNPPFHSAEPFIRKALETADEKVAMLLRLSFLAGSARRDGLWAEYMPSRVWLFSDRLTFYPDGKSTGGSGTLDHAWYVWDKSSRGISGFDKHALLGHLPSKLSMGG